VVTKLDKERVIVTPPDGPKLDCSAKVLDPKSESCRRQFCSKHTDHPTCLTE